MAFRFAEGGIRYAFEQPQPHPILTLCHQTAWNDERRKSADDALTYSFFEMYKMRFRRARIHCITQAVISSPPFKWTYDFQWWFLRLPHPLITPKPLLTHRWALKSTTTWIPWPCDTLNRYTFFLNLIRPKTPKNEWFKRENVAFTLKIGNFIRKKPYSTPPSYST